MIAMREYLSRHEFAKHEGFRWRNPGEISRVEGFSDAVFAFAVTLLVVSLEVPKTYEELIAGMRGFVAFGAAFALLFVIWTNQYRFFRQYGLQDGPTLWLNAALLFVVLFFTYPLKFLFSWLSNAWSGGGGLVRLPSGETVPMVPDGRQAELMIIYGGGYLAVFTVLFFMYLHAWHRRKDLELTPLELFLTREIMQEQACQIAIALVSLSFAFLHEPGWAGLTYIAIGPTIMIHSGLMAKARRRRFGI